MTDIRGFYERHPCPAPPSDLHLVELYRDPIRHQGRVQPHLPQAAPVAAGQKEGRELGHG